MRFVDTKQNFIRMYTESRGQSKLSSTEAIEIITIAVPINNKNILPQNAGKENFLSVG